MSRTKMSYDKNKDQWYVVLSGKEYGLHCGESFELYIGRKAIYCQLELANNWYIIMENTRLDLREDDQYMVKI